MGMREPGLYDEADERRGAALDAIDDCDYRDDEPARRTARGCRCFAPGEAPGYCPGPDSCPMCEEPAGEGERLRA
jgi:hypothetical protein